MATSILAFLEPLLPGSLERIVFPNAIRLLLEHLSTELPLPAGPASAPFHGDVKASANDTAGGFAELNIAPLGPAIAFDLRLTGPAAAPTGFQFDLEPADGLLKLPLACRPANLHTDPEGKRTLVEAPAGQRVQLKLNGADPLAIRIEGRVGSAARQGFVALDAAQQGLMTVGLDPPAFLLGGQGFGLHLPGGLTVDSSPDRAPEPVVHGDGRALPSETPAWQGIALRQAELFLPTSTPLIGAGPIPIELDLGMPNGLYGHTEVHLPEQGSRPAFDVLLTWDDPGATSLASALPSVIEFRTSWALDTASGPPGLGTITMLGGRPLSVTGRFSRKPGTMDLEFGLVVEAGGDQGLLTVRATDTAGKVVVTATALATAFIADASPPNAATQPNYDGFGSTLHALLVAASGLSAFLEDGSVTVHAVEIDAGLAAAGTRLTLRVDYSVNVRIQTIGLGFMSIGMNPAVPMRLRYRNVRLLVDFAQSGLDRFHLSFGEADVGVEDPGGWQIQSPGSVKDLFDVLGSRSGHGSQWFEIDLRFALDLGPVKVSGATVRVTLGAGGLQTPEIRGLDASLEMPGLFEGRGTATLGQNNLDLALAAKIVPLNIGAFASLSYGDCGGGVQKLVLTLGVDLPGPIPLANSGLGLYGLGGIFGVNARLPVPAGPDPVSAQLALEPMLASIYQCEPGGSVFGLGAVIGTAADLGFTFSARAVIVIGLPDFALRASLDGKVLSERVSIAGSGAAPGAGLSFLGLLSIAPDGVTIALRGHFEIPVLFTVDLPFGAYFPLKTSGAGVPGATISARDWYVHLGSDGQPGRGPGPMQARILPDVLNVGAWAFLMVRGNGIPSLGGDPTMSPQGFSIGFGAGFNAQYGVPLVYLELSASAVIALGTNPFLLAGKGNLAGSLHLGPISIGVSAEIRFVVAPALGDQWVQFEVCGEVDLFFFSLQGCVTIEIGEHGKTIPAPVDWPLRSIALSDHRYTRIAEAFRSDNRPALNDIPVVWPDIIPILQFANGPANALEPGPFTQELIWNASAVGDGVVGNERLGFTYRLKAITLSAIDPDTGVATPVNGPLDAAWQAPKGGVNGEPGARELALLTWQSALWTRKLIDGAVNDPADPIPGIAGQCRVRHVPTDGWALGASATRSSPGDTWRLPSEAAPGPFASVFEVRITASWRQIPIAQSTLPLLPVSMPIRLGGPMPLSLALEAAGRRFGGVFDLPHVSGFARDVDPAALANQGEESIVASLSFSQPLFDPVFAVLLPDWPQNFRDERVIVELIGGAGPSSFPIDNEEAGPGDELARSYARSGGPYLGVSMTYPAMYHPRILGLRGVSAAAVQAADDATKADNAAGTKAKGNKQTLTPRAMLLPNRIYRIDVTVTGQGHRADVEPAATATPHTDTYWFRTPSMKGPAPSQGLQYVQSSEAVALAHYDEFVNASNVLQRSDSFDPVYLKRYIDFWVPGDHSRFWFLDDPIGVQIAVNHVPDLAFVYDHDTRVRVRRTDPTRGHPDPFDEDALPTSLIYQTAVSQLASESELRLHTLTSLADGCPYPAPGATLGGKPTLQPLAQYEAFLSFPFLDSAGSGQSGGARIPGVLFSTSRYHGPLELFAALGFVAGGAPGAGLSGSVPVTRMAIAAGERVADGALEQALAALGLGRWPPADAARSTGLWSLDGDVWSLHGVLLEAPEPIHRPDSLGFAEFGGRVRVSTLVSGGRRFEHVIRSSSGDRLLFLTGNAFVPAAPLELGVQLQEIPIGVAPPALPGHLRCPVQSVPEFAEDLS